MQRTYTALVALPLTAVLCGAADKPQWISAWSAAPDQRIAAPMSGSTVRMIVRPTISGNAVRVRIENTMAPTPVVFSAAYIGQVQSGAGLVAGSNTQLTFNGNLGLTLAAGAGAYSDALTFPVVALARYAVSLDVTTAQETSGHALGLVTNYMAAGAHSADPGGSNFRPIPDGATSGLEGAPYPLYWVSSVDVAGSSPGAIVALGDSITDGLCSTRTNNGAATGAVIPDMYNRWTDLLAGRLLRLLADQARGVVDEGISANTVVAAGGSGPPALVRLNSDVPGREGVTHVIFFEGTNDIVLGADSATIIAADQQIIDQVHAAGWKIVGATIIPRGGSSGWTHGMEVQRLALNDWIRHQARFDGVIDFDTLMQGAVNPANNSVALASQFSCFDQIHPNAAGYQAMAQFIDISLFAPPSGASVPDNAARAQASWNALVTSYSAPGRPGLFLATAGKSAVADDWPHSEILHTALDLAMLTGDYSGFDRALPALAQ
jgi:lysophospholipase L1-like esterase